MIFKLQDSYTKSAWGWQNPYNQIWSLLTTFQLPRRKMQSKTKQKQTKSQKTKQSKIKKKKQQQQQQQHKKEERKKKKKKKRIPHHT